MLLMIPTLTLIIVFRHLALEELDDIVALASIFLRGTLPHQMQGELTLGVNYHYFRPPFKQQANLNAQRVRTQHNHGLNTLGLGA